MGNNQENLTYNQLEYYQAKINSLENQLRQCTNDSPNNALSFEQRLSEALKNFHTPSIESISTKRSQLHSLQMSIEQCIRDIATYLNRNYQLKADGIGCKAIVNSIYESLKHNFGSLRSDSDAKEFITVFNIVLKYLKLAKKCLGMLNYINKEIEKLDAVFSSIASNNEEEQDDDWLGH